MASHETTVYFAMQRTERGEIGMADLAPAYLAALSVLAKRPPPPATSRVETESDWSDYDHPIEREVHRFGDGDYGLRLHITALFSPQRRPAGAIGTWAMDGLPRGSRAQGECRLPLRGQGFARLTTSGEAARCKRAAAAFREALAGLDVRSQEDGVAIEGVEYLLDRSLSGLDLAGEAQWIVPPLERGIAAVPAERPAGAAARYLLLLVRIAQRDDRAAAALLAQLSRLGDGLAFSHPVTLVPLPDNDGALGWAGADQPFQARHALHAAEAVLAERRGDRTRARALLQALAAAPDFPFRERVCPRLALLGG